MAMYSILDARSTPSRGGDTESRICGAPIRRLIRRPGRRLKTSFVSTRKCIRARSWDLRIPVNKSEWVSSLYKVLAELNDLTFRVRALHRIDHRMAYDRVPEVRRCGRT